MKIKNIAKPMALLSASAVLISASGCADTSWSFKTKNKTFSNGAWIYYTYAAMNDAITKIEESSEKSFDILTDDLTSKKVEKKDAVDWIYAEAKKQAENYLTVEKLCADNKLKLDEDTFDSMKKTYASYFDAGYMDIYKELGVSSDTFTDIYAGYDLRYEQLFDYIYSEGGSKEVTDDEITKYFKENYTSYYYISYSLKTTDDEGNETDIDDETKDNVISNFAKYAKELNDGSTTDEIDEEYKTDFEVETSAGSKNTVVLSESNLPEEVQKVIEELDDKKATVKTINDTHYMIYKGSLDDEAKAMLDDSQETTSTITKDTVLHKMKDEDFKDYIETERKKLKYDTNEDCLSKYSVQRTIDIVKKFYEDQSAG